MSHGLFMIVAAACSVAGVISVATGEGPEWFTIAALYAIAAGVNKERE